MLGGPWVAHRGESWVDEKLTWEHRYTMLSRVRKIPADRFVYTVYVPAKAGFLLGVVWRCLAQN